MFSNKNQPNHLGTADWLIVLLRLGRDPSLFDHIYIYKYFIVLAILFAKIQKKTFNFVVIKGTFLFR
jgi:hypothetical protein